MQPIQRNRLTLLVVLVLCVATVIAARIYQLQIVEHESFAVKADRQHERRIEIPATRGAILDRNGIELATSVEAHSLYVHPHRVENAEGIAGSLAPVLGLSRRALLGKLRSSEPFVYLARLLTPAQLQAVENTGLPVGGDAPFGVIDESRRDYPRGRCAVHVVGFANIDGQGVEGIEKQFDWELQGDPTVYLLEQDARRGGLKRPIETPEKPPLDVVLTIDSVLQHIVERELQQAIRSTGAKAGSVVILDPTNGQIMALANWPAADPNQYGKAGHPARRNRAVVDAYEPGSTFKVVPLAALLERKKVSMDQRYYCEKGTYRTGRRSIRDISPHGSLSLREVLTKSSNIGMVKATRSLSSEELRGTISDFGFGARTGIELPGEARGLLREVPEWSDYTQASLAFGQEVTVSAMQMASALSVIANDGVLISPRVVLGTREPDGRFVPRARPAPRRVVSSRTASTVRSVMEAVIREGTGSRAGVVGYRVAGKTGTAQKAVAGGYSDEEYMASFGGFAPAGRPRLVGLVVLDSPQGRWTHGGQVAAPVFSRIMEDALRRMRVPSDDGGAPKLEPRSEDWQRRLENRRVAMLAEPSRLGIVPDLRGMGAREAISRLAAHGFGTQLSGSGVVTAQQPAAGERLEPGRACKVRLATTVSAETRR